MKTGKSDANISQNYLHSIKSSLFSENIQLKTTKNMKIFIHLLKRT